MSYVKFIAGDRMLGTLSRFENGRRVFPVITVAFEHGTMSELMFCSSFIDRRVKR